MERNSGLVNQQNSSPARRAIPQKSPKSSTEVIAEVFPSELPTPPSKVVAALFQAEPAIPQKSPKPSTLVIVEVFPSELPTPASEVVAPVFQEEPSFEVEESPPITKGDSSGFSDTDRYNRYKTKCEISSGYR